MKSSPLLICALRVSTEIGEGWVKVWEKHSSAVSPRLFSSCLFCHVLEDCFDLSRSIISWFPQGNALHHEVFESIQLWAICIICLWRSDQRCLYDLSSLCTPHLSPFLFFSLFKSPPLFFLRSFRLCSTYRRCWSRSPGRNLWPLGLLPSAACGRLWMILKTDSERNFVDKSGNKCSIDKLTTDVTHFPQ